jgi:hypothetical protein
MIGKNKCVLFQNKNIKILHPNNPNGILVFHTFSHRYFAKNGLFPSSKFVMDYGSEVFHNEIFFRAPYIKNLESSNNVCEYFDNNIINHYQNLAVIRICPFNTFVFSSEFRSHDNWGPIKGKQKINETRKPMIQYMEQLEKNKNKMEKKKEEESNWYNLITSDVIFDRKYQHKYRCNPNYSQLSIAHNSEILAEVDHIPFEWFVECYWNGEKIVSN